MSSSAAQSYRGLALAAATVVTVASCVLVLTSSSTAPIAMAEPTGAGSSTGAQAGTTGTGAPAAATPRADGPGAVHAAVITHAGAEQIKGADRDVARFRRVSVDTSALPADAAEAQHAVELPLFDDTTILADLAAPTFRPEGGYRTWSGTIHGATGSTVVFVEQDGVLSGYLSGPTATYRLRPMPDGSTQIEQIDESKFPAADIHPSAPASLAAAPEDPDEHSHAPGTPAHSHDAPAGSPSGSTGAPTGSTVEAPQLVTAAAEAPVVDVLVAYTSAAKTRMGGQAGMDADIALMIEQTNTAFATSGINAVVRLAHSAEVSLNQPVSQAAIEQLTAPNDGKYDELQVMRDQYGADLIALIVDGTGAGYCGMAYIPGGIGAPYARLGTSVDDARCATGNTSFTHELGHNFGAAHDRGSWSGTPVLPYGYDWVNPAQRWRTVMSYENACSGCARLLRFSNPDQTYNGAPLGAPAGAPNAADNRAVLNTTASTIAGYRGAPAPASLTLTAPTSGQQVVASGKLVATWSTSGYLGSDAKVELLRGTTVVKVLTAKVALGTGRYEYVVPLATTRGNDYRLGITPLLAPQYAVTSDVFSVVDPVITPTSSAAASAGGAARVNWTYTGAPGGSVKVELIKDGKSLAVLKSGAVLGTGGTGGLDLTLPAALNNGGGYQFRTTLSAVANAPSDTGTFTVTSSRQLVVTAPGSGEGRTAGAPLTVTWTAAGDLGASVRAELVTGDLVVFTSPPAPVAARSLTFTPPAKLPSGGDYKVRLVAASFPTVIATSGRFSLAGSEVTVTSQSTPGSITAGRALTITFATVGAPGTAVTLEAVSPDHPPVTISSSTPLATGTYTWTVPVNLPKTDWRIHATVVGNPLVTSTSAASTTVMWPEVSASTSPSGAAGAPVTVSWAYTDGAVAPVRVRLMQGTRAVSTVTTSGSTIAGGTGSLTYRLPIDLAPGDYQFEVAAAANPAIIRTTSSIPVVRPTMTASGASAVARGQTATISWTYSNGAAAPVRIDLVQGSRVVLVRNGAVTADNGTGSFVYTAPATLPPGTYTLQIRPATLAGSNVIQATRTFTVT